LITYAIIQGYTIGTLPTATQQCWPDWRKYFD